MDDVNDTETLIARLQDLRARSGLSYRQMEQRAAARGDVLPRSTVADLLRRQTLPRPDMLRAFVRACDDDHRLDQWLAARDRLVAAPADASPPAVPEPAVAGRAHRLRLPHVRPEYRAAIALALVAAAVFAGAGKYLAGPAGEVVRPTGPGVLAESPAPVPDGWTRIRPLRNPDLCLTEGRDRSGRYAGAVAAQRPCDEALPPRTYVRAVAGGMHQVEWHHPSKGVGCLTLIQDGLMEPWDDCHVDTAVQGFRLEPSGAAASAFRLRLTGDRCLGIRGEETAGGAEVVAQACAPGAHQIFLIGAE